MDGGGGLLGWSVVANVSDAVPWGPDHEVRRGTRHFSGGTKVWVLPPQ